VLKDAFQKRFNELDVEYGQIQWNTNPSHDVYAEPGFVQKWATSAQDLIRAVYGVESPHYKNFEKSFARGATYQSSVQALYGVFRSAKEGFEGGYVFDVERQVSGEVFGDFVAMAKRALEDGFKDVAAVLACAALEDALKRYATASGLDVKGKAMDEVISALKAKRLIEGPFKSILDTMPRLRNATMHAQWDKVTRESVGGLVGLVEQFLLNKFG